MSSRHADVLSLVSAIATKVGESRPELGAQAIGSALYGMQRLTCDALEVRTLVAAIAEKVELSTDTLDAQAIGNALFGLQSMRSNYAEVRALVSAIAKKLISVDSPMDSKGIGSALYGLNSMSSEEPQVRALLAALATSIDQSKCVLTGEGVADALFGLAGMTFDCVELRALLKALANRIDGGRGKLEAQEIGNALYGLSGMSSDMPEVRLIVSKLVGKISRSKAYLRSQHIGRSLLGLQRFTAESPEVRSLLKQVRIKIAESDRTRMTSKDIGDSLFGLQGMSSRVNEVQELVGELAKKVAATAAVLTPRDIGRALFGLQGLSSASSIFAESAIGLDDDELQFLMSTLWDKIKVVTAPFPLSSVAMGLQGLIQMKDPIAENIRMFLYYNAVNMPKSTVVYEMPKDPENGVDYILKADVISAVRSMRINNLLIPKWLALEYIKIEDTHTSKPVIPMSKPDKMIASRYASSHQNIKVQINALVDGFRLDMYFPEINFNVELDGTAHGYPARVRFDRERDQFLLEEKGIETFRVNLVGLNSDSALKLVHERVLAKQEAKADADIQGLYLKDQQLQKLYMKERK